MPTVTALTEVGLIARLRRRLRDDPSVIVGIGDDAAVVRLADRHHVLLIASDLLVEGVHFDRTRVPAWRIGWKALACNVSDIAAMAGQPRWAVVSLGIPPTTPVRFVDELYTGLQRCASRYRLSVVGGDTVRAPQVVINVAIIGTARRDQVVQRHGARVGDVLFVTGRLGGSYPSGRHARLLPRVTEAQALVRRCPVHAMMDLSDGLASDAWQMSRASRVVLELEESQVPVHRAAQTCRRPGCPCRRWPGRSAGYHAVMDGEDFELLFAVDRRAATQVPRRIGSCPVTPIGRVIRCGIGVQWRRADGRVRLLRPTGFRHFHGKRVEP